MQTTIGYFWNDYGKGSIGRFLDSLKAVYPECEAVNCAIHCPEMYAMAARTKAYALLRKKVRGTLILLDTDIVAKKPIPYFGCDFALTRTRESCPLMPYNGGVLVVNDTDNAHAFLDEVWKCATILPADFTDKMWYIDQLAIAYAARGYKGYVELPEEYNYVPRFDGDKQDVYFMHYKGNRKDWQ